MSIHRKNIHSSVVSNAHTHTSIGSIYSITSDLHDDDHRHHSSGYFSSFFITKLNVYHLLERQEGTRTLAYHLFVFCLTLISLICGSISTIDEWRPILDRPLFYGEFALWIFFVCELFLRIWSAGCVTKYRTMFGRLMFIRRPVILLDILTLSGFTISLAMGIQLRAFSSLSLKFLPPLQMIRFVRIDRQLSSWKILKGIIVTHRQELTVTLVIAFMFLITGSYLVYLAETSADSQSNSGQFRSMADAMWFSIITMTTIGFGDLYPTTYMAKMITTTICFLGVAFWCLPAGIIGSGLAIKVQEQKRDEALNRLVPAAATVIRNWWRLRCAYHGDRYPSTWRIYTLIQRRVNGLSPESHTPQSAPPMTSHSTSKAQASRNNFRYHGVNSTTGRSHRIRRKSIVNMEDLPARYITVIKIIRMLKYSAACKKFQQAKRPIDIKDVVKENTQMNNRLSLMLNDVQRRLDLIFGTTKPASYLSDEQKRQLSLTARLEKVEEISHQFESKLTYLEQLALTLVENV